MVLNKVFVRITRKKFEEFSFTIQCDACNEIFLKKREAKFCSKSCVNKGRKFSEERKLQISRQSKGEKNPFFGRKHDEATRLQMSKKSREGMENMSAEERGRWLSSLSASSKGEKNPFFGRKHDEATRLQMSQSRAAKIASGELVIKNRSYGGWFVSKKAGRVHFDSSWELIRMYSLDSDHDVISWSRNHGIKLQYEVGGKIHNYVPDFFIQHSNKKIIEEVKGFEKQETRAAKKLALENFCKIRGFDSSQLSQIEIEKMCRDLFDLSTKQFREQCKLNGVFS